MNATDKRELLQLLESVVENRLSRTGDARLAQLLTGSAEAREVYRTYLQMHADLATATVATSSTSAELPLRKNSSRASRIHSTTTAVLALAAGVLLMFVLGRPGHRGDDAREIAVLDGIDAVVWSGDVSGRHPGDVLERGPLAIERGRVRLRMRSGVEVALAGPARVELLDAKALRIVAGEIDVNVPEQGIGFRVITPSADVVDLGTAFHVRVDDAGATEVHVTQGLVVARAVDSDGVVQVKRSEAARFEALSGDISAIPFRATSTASSQGRSTSADAPDVRPLPPGARIVFLGDRMTDRETHLLWIADAFRHMPDEIRPRLFNAGVVFPLSFHEDDYRSHVAVLRPTHAVLEYGPEIAAELDEARTPADFRRDLERLIERLQRDGIQPILETGFPLGTSHPLSQSRVDEYNAILRTLAVEQGLTLVDVDRWFRAATVPLEDLVVPSGLFPAAAGHREIAACILATWGSPQLPQSDSPTTPLLPGALTTWRFRLVERSIRLDATEAKTLRPDATWTELLLPQHDDALTELSADKQHLVGYRDRRRGFATNFYGSEGNQIQAYAEVVADEARAAVLNVGAGVQSVWLNGERVLVERRYGGWHAGKARIPVHLLEGVNRILIEARGGFFASVTDQLDWELP